MDVCLYPRNFINFIAITNNIGQNITQKNSLLFHKIYFRKKLFVGIIFLKFSDFFKNRR